jgi:cobalt-precorrin-5B (C1)-methyltransferase
MESEMDVTQLRRGWTTGACAAAGAKAAYTALLTGDFPDPVDIPLPGGQRPAFALAETSQADGAAMAAIIKDAGDDPDVTHGALIRTTVRPRAAGLGLAFKAGRGVGTVTRPGLPLAVGEPAINPGPRTMIEAALREVADPRSLSLDLEVEVSIRDGEQLALKTLNGRLGIVGGLSVLGTTGIVVPFSCASWIHSIHRGIDVARAAGMDHIAGATGSTSEAAIAALDSLPEVALIDMGDFVGGMLKYVRVHPIRRVTVAGGFAKMVKLSQGLLDLHSRAGAVDLNHLARLATEAGATDDLARFIATANSALDALEQATAQGIDVPALVAERAVTVAATTLRGAPIAVDVVVFDRKGELLARAHAPIGG